MKRRIADWIVIEKLADVIIAHDRRWEQWSKPAKPKGCLVDIGAGYSTDLFTVIALRWNIKHYTCDIVINKTYHDSHIVFRGPSSEFIKVFNDTPAIVLIDGSHAYDDVLMEFDFFLPRMAEGGVIFIHDTLPLYEKWIDPKSCGDGYRLRQELKKRDDVESFTWPYTANNLGLTMVMKKEANPPYYRS